jgi:hypothetical protein
MSIFESTTPDVETPVTGQVETGAEETKVSPSIEEQGEVVETVPEQQEETQTEQPEQPQFDYAKNYNELRKDYTRKTQELAALKRQNAPQPPQQGQGMNTDQFWQAMQTDPIGTIANIANQMAQVQAQQYVAPIYEERQLTALGQNLENVAKDYPQLADPKAMHGLFSKVSEIAHEIGNPNLAQYPTKRILKLAAQELYGDSAAKVYQQAKKAGQEEALNNIRQKQGLSVNAGVKPKDTPKSIEDQIADSIVSAGRRPGIFGG